MQLYLPLAEMSLNFFLLLGLGGAIGFISGLFGVGGGFLLTPLLIFAGIPAAVAVATSSVHLAASSVTGTLACWRRNALDLKLSVVLTAGGLVGTLLGVSFFNQMRKLGHLDLVITLSYVTLLMSVGTLMFVESVGAVLDRHRGRTGVAAPAGDLRWAKPFPLKMRFERSKLTISLIPLLVLGVLIGFIGTVLGIGGGFLVVPVLIYLFRVPTSVVVGTSLFQILVTMCAATFFHAVMTQSVDIVLGLTLVAGGVIGAQFGGRAGQALKGEHFRLLLALLILIVGVRFAADIIVRPPELYSITLQELER